MTKKHYIVMARMLHAQRRNFHEERFFTLVKDIAWVLSLENPRFSSAKFIEAVFTDHIDADKWP